MKKSIWIFLLAVLVPGAVLGWLALRSAEEQQIIFERRTAELYQKETETLATSVREAVEGERRAFGDTVHRLLANGDPEALARDFANTLADAWPRKAIGFALDRNGKLLSPSVADAARDVGCRSFLADNGSFLSGSESAMVYAVQTDGKLGGYNANVRAKSLANVSQGVRLDDPVSKGDGADADRAAWNAAPQKMQEALAGEESLRKSGAKFANAPQPTGLRDGDAFMQLSQPGLALADKLAEDIGAKRSEMAVSAAAGPAPPAPRKPAPSAPLAAGGGGLELGAAIAPARDAPASIVMRTTEADPARAQKPATEAGTRGLKERSESLDRRRTAMNGRVENERMAEVSELQKAQSPPRSQPQPAPPPVPQLAFMKDLEFNFQRQNQTEGKVEEFTKSSQNRLVEPQQLLGAPSNAVSLLVPSAAEFRTLTEGSDEGMVSRFVQDKLDLLFWIRPPEAPEMVFGCLVEAANLPELWNAALEKHGTASRGSYGDSDAQPGNVMALLDDRGRPAAMRPASAAVQDWKRPFVASEIGEALPHWEAALYLASPTALAEGARGLRRTLTFTIVGAVALIALGGWLVVADARRQLALAQQKTDFVSNVSHELKTPLTSIRMFAELMHDRPPPPEKQGQYLRIITVEAERLTRLINNVLDFAKLGRKQKQYEKKPLDLHGVISRVWESQGLHLREAGFQTRWEAAPGPYPLLGDDDALAQVLVNLLSNAEKYSTDRKEVELHTWIEDGWVNVTVLDRGMGVPKGEERKIFDAFYRAHDSLSSGIQGSGLGLTLAQRVAREHGGEIQFERREGGGSRFTMRLPLAGAQESGVRSQESGRPRFS